MSEENAKNESDEAEPVEPVDPTEPVENDADEQDSAAADTAEAPAEEQAAAPAPSTSSNESANEPTIGDEISVTQSTRVSAADGSDIHEPIADISMLLDIPVTLSMEIGQTKISISELLKLGKDSVIELQRLAHEPLDVLVNGTLVAHGEAVVVGDRFGIRLTDVISPQERLRKFS